MFDLTEGVFWYVILLFSTVLHEAAHAFAAKKLGDNTAYLSGQVTLDPLPHIKREPFGLVIVPLLTYFTGGWMVGWASAPYNYLWARRFPKRSAMMSFAGPLSNLGLVIISVILIRAGIFLDLLEIPSRFTFTQVVESTGDGMYAGVATLLSLLFSLNTVLFVFNLLPVPPLDGSGILPFFLSEKLAARFMDFINQPMFSFIGILVAWNLFGRIYSPFHLFFMKLLYPEIGFY